VRQCPRDLIRMVRDGTGHDNRLVHKREETSVVESRSNIKQKAYGTSAVNPRHRRRMVKTEAVSSPILDDVAVVDNQFDQEEEASIDEVKPSTSSKRPTKRARMEKKRGRPRAFASNTVFNDDNLELVNVDDLCDQVMAVHTPRVGKKGRKRLTLVESPVPVEESTPAAPMEDGEHEAADKEEETTAGSKKRKAKPRRPQAPKKKKETDLALNVAVSVVKQAQAIEVAPGPSSSKSPKKRTSRVSSAAGNITGTEPTTRNMPIEATQPGRRKAAIAADAINTSILNTSSTASDEIVADRLMQKWKKRLGK